MNNRSETDIERLIEISEILKNIKKESLKDELIGALKWALISQQNQPTQ